MTIDQFNSLTKNCVLSKMQLPVIVLPWQWAKHFVRSSCFCIFAMNRSQINEIIQTSVTLSNLPTNEPLQCLTKHLYVIPYCVVWRYILSFLFFCRQNPPKVIPTRWNGTLSFTSCPRRLWSLPLYRGLAVPQSPTTVSLTYCEITEIHGIHWYLISSKNLHPQQILNSIFFHSWNYVHTNL